QADPILQELRIEVSRQASAEVARGKDSLERLDRRARVGHSSSATRQTRPRAIAWTGQSSGCGSHWLRLSESSRRSGRGREVRSWAVVIGNGAPEATAKAE